MPENMRRLHSRGATNRGICVDAEGAVLGPACVLVSRTAHGFRAIEVGAASTIQKCLIDGDRDRDWLFAQCQRIADALDMGEIALAQIYGLRIPIGDLNDQQLGRIALSGLAKAGFNPDEPRVPKGDPHGGEWTDGGGSAVALDDLTIAPDTAPASDGALGRGPGGTAAASPASNTSAGDLTGSDAASSPPIEYSIVPAATGASSGRIPATAEAPANVPEANALEPATGSSPILPPGTVAEANASATSLLGQLPAETIAGLAELAARMTAATMVFRILFIPSNGSVVVEGKVANAPDLSYRYDRDTGIVQVWQDDWKGARTLLDTGRIGVDGRFYDESGDVIGRALSSAAVIDPDTLPGYRSQSNTDAGAATRPLALADTADPKLCPDPSLDRPGARSENIAYQQYVSILVNGRALPAGLAVSLWNPVSGKFVVFDDCRLSDGTMIDAKGPRYAYLLQYQQPRESLTQEFLDQANRQLQAAGGRQIVWHFAEREAADFVRILFEANDIHIKVLYTPWRR